MGVDIIIGGHPHVVQPMELIHAEGSEHPTVCIYSLGNAVSNQRRELISNARKGHTEDGAMFSYTIKRVNNVVSLESVNVTSANFPNLIMFISLIFIFYP